MEKLNVSVLAKKFSDESAAYELLEEMRWPHGPECPHCGSVDNAYFLSSARRTTTGKVSSRRLWKCAECRMQFSVLVGTIFERSQVPLSKWLMALYMMASSKNSVAAFELHRTLGVTNKTAWFMAHRIREAMKRDDLASTMRGTILADETWIGGKPSNRHASASSKPVRVDRVDGNQNTDKTPVLSLISTLTGEVRSAVVPNVTGAVLRKVIASQVDMAGSSCTLTRARGTPRSARSSPPTRRSTTWPGSTCGARSPRTTLRGTSRS